MVARLFCEPREALSQVGWEYLIADSPLEYRPGVL
jgi:hypothetical protein